MLLKAANRWQQDRIGEEKKDGTYIQFFFKSSLSFCTKFKFIGLAPQHIRAATMLSLQILHFHVNRLQCVAAFLMKQNSTVTTVSATSRKIKRR